MQREDLPKGYGGWQVLDPTPQERSSGRALLIHLEMGFFTHIYISDLNCIRLNPAKEITYAMYIIIII